MTSLSDWARFQPDDPVPLVVAAFACLVCLHRADLVFLDNDEGGYSATCRCTGCATTWIVAMRADQFLRVKLLPPRELAVLDSTYRNLAQDWLFPI